MDSLRKMIGKTRARGRRARAGSVRCGRRRPDRTCRAHRVSFWCQRGTRQHTAGPAATHGTPGPVAGGAGRRTARTAGRRAEPRGLRDATGSGTGVGRGSGSREPGASLRRCAAAGRRQSDDGSDWRAPGAGSGSGLPQCGDRPPVSQTGRAAGRPAAGPCCGGPCPCRALGAPGCAMRASTAHRASRSGDSAAGWVDGLRVRGVWRAAARRQGLPVGRPCGADGHGPARHACAECMCACARGGLADPIQPCCILAEFLGVFLFSFFGGGCDANSVSTGLPTAAIGNGLLLAVLVYMTAGISGGHLNPALSTAFFVTGR